MDEDLALLRKIAEKSFDYLFGETNPEFAKQCGGMSALRSELVVAMEEYREATDVDCRSIP